MYINVKDERAMKTNRLPILIILFRFCSKVLFIISIYLCVCSCKTDKRIRISDQFKPLPSGSVQFTGYLEDYIHNSILHWNKGVVPYSGFVEMFRSGRSYFARGEMWGKAVRSGCMFYRYNQDQELKKILLTTVADLLTTIRENGSTSGCTKHLPENIVKTAGS